jgi:preprotein translocase subunit SecB
MIEAPRLLFPFARSIIATATRDGGLPPLMISPIDFVALYRRHMSAAKAEAAQAEAAQAGDGGANGTG